MQMHSVFEITFSPRSILRMCSQMREYISLNTCICLVYLVVMSLIKLRLYNVKNVLKMSKTPN